jgi:hypothetical protein
LEQFKRWARNPGIRDCLRSNDLSPEVKEARMRELFGLAPKPAAESAQSGDAAPNGHTPAPALDNPNQGESK